MNIGLTIKKTIKRLAGKLISKLTKPKKPPLTEPKIPSPPLPKEEPEKPIVPEPKIPPAVTTIPRFEAPEIPPVPPVTLQTEPPQPQPPPPQPPPQNSIVSFATSLGKSLGKKVVGKAIKTGAQKIAGWAATKLSLAAIPEPLVSKAILILSLGLDALKLVGKGIKGIFGKIGGFLTGFLPQTGQTAQKASDFTGNIVNKTAFVIGSVFAGLTTVSLPAALPLAGVGGALGAIVLITVITVMAVGGAFQKGQGEQISGLGTPVVAQAPSSTSHFAETVIWTLNQCGISAVNKSSWARTENCLRSSTLTNKEAIIAQFHFSVYQVGPGLQCVGFVRGIMAALGKDPGGNRDARDYLNPPPPPGYQPINTNMPMVQKGDLVIMRGTNFGHIAIVIEKAGDLIKVAQAWGTNGGAIQITEVNPIYFDGFLRPL